MSFGYSVGDAIQLTQLAWKVVQNSRKACGEYDGLTREASSLHLVLERLQDEKNKSESLLNRPDDCHSEELQTLVSGCSNVLGKLERILEKYNALSDKERSGKKLWQKVRFGNGQLEDTAQLRARLTFYISALTLFLNMVSTGTVGRVERKMDEAGGELKEIRKAVNGITAHLMAENKGEGSVFTVYPDDDKKVWRELRRELYRDGFSSTIIHHNKKTIKAYIKELGSRGLLDDIEPPDIHSCHAIPSIDEPQSLEQSTESDIQSQFDSKPSQDLETLVIPSSNNPTLGNPQESDNEQTMSTAREHCFVHREEPDSNDGVTFPQERKIGAHGSITDPHQAGIDGEDRYFAVERSGTVDSLLYRKSNHKHSVAFNNAHKVYKEPSCQSSPRVQLHNTTTRGSSELPSLKGKKIHNPSRSDLGLGFRIGKGSSISRNGKNQTLSNKDFRDRHEHSKTIALSEDKRYQSLRSGITEKVLNKLDSMKRMAWNDRKSRPNAKTLAYLEDIDSVIHSADATVKSLDSVKKGDELVDSLGRTKLAEDSTSET